MTKKRLFDDIRGGEDEDDCDYDYSTNSGEIVLLTWNGKPLDDEHCLADYGFPQNGMTIHASTCQLRGGCFVVSFSIFIVILMSLVGSVCTCGLSLVLVPFLMPLLFVLPLFCL